MSPSGLYTNEYTSFAENSSSTSSQRSTSLQAYNASHCDTLYAGTWIQQLGTGGTEAQKVWEPLHYGDTWLITVGKSISSFTFAHPHLETYSSQARKPGTFSCPGSRRPVSCSIPYERRTRSSFQDYGKQCFWQHQKAVSKVWWRFKSMTATILQQPFSIFGIDKLTKTNPSHYRIPCLWACEWL